MSRCSINWVGKPAPSTNMLNKQLTAASAEQHLSEQDSPCKHYNCRLFAVAADMLSYEGPAGPHQQHLPLQVQQLTSCTKGSCKASMYAYSRPALQCCMPAHRPPGCSDLQARMHLARALKSAGQPARSVEVYKSVLQLQPNHQTAHYKLGSVLRHMGKLEAASQSYR